MDANKLIKLREMDYSIPLTCEFCIHSVFKNGSDYGVCDINTYEHLRQTANDDRVSVFRGGTCPDVIVAWEENMPLSEAWKEFLE